MDNLYHFDKKTLQFTEVNIKNNTNFKRFVGIFLIFCIVVFGSFKLVNLRSLQKENEKLNNELVIIKQDLKNNFKSLNEIIERDNYLYRKILEIDTIPYTIRQSGIGGHDKYKNNSYKNLKNNIDKFNRMCNIQLSSFIDIYDKYKRCGDSIILKPSGVITDNNTITSFFGYRIHPILNTENFHYGIDITEEEGDNIYSTINGMVIKKDFNSTYGNYVIISNKKYNVLYAHLSKINVELNNKINKGDIIGYVGNTGLSTNSHVHYEVKYCNEYCNPINYN